MNCPWVADVRLSNTQVAELILAMINGRQKDLTQVIDAFFISRYCDAVTSVKAATRRPGWERQRIPEHHNQGERSSGPFAIQEYRTVAIVIVAIGGNIKVLTTFRKPLG